MPGKPIRLGRRARAVGPRSPGPGSDLASRAAVTGPGPWARASDSGPGPIGARGGHGGSWGRCFLLGRPTILNSELNVLGNLEREAC